MRLHLLALVVPAILAPIVACEDSSSSSSGNFTPEAGPGFEAGPPSEAGPLPEAGPLAKGVTVSVIEGALPKKDVRVLLHDATGAVTGEAKTDTNGLVLLTTVPNMVTVLTTRPRASAPDEPAQITFLGVEDGDKLVARLPDPTPIGSAVLGSYSVSFTAPFANGVYYDLAIENCSALGGMAFVTPLTVDLRENCGLGPKYGILARASDVNGVVLAFANATNVVKPPALATADVGPLTYAAAGATRHVATNLPANTEVENDLLYSLVNERLFYTGGPTGLVTDVGGAATPTATGFADAYQSYVSIRRPGQVLSTKGFLRREPTTAPAALTLPTFDFANALPFINGATEVGAGRPDLTMTAEGPMTASDGGAMVLLWQFPSGGEGTWTFVLPPTTTSLKVPALPADASAFVPLAGAFVDSITFVEATQLASYKDVKAQLVGLFLSKPLNALVDAQQPLPTAGTARITRWISGKRG